MTLLPYLSTRPQTIAQLCRASGLPRRSVEEQIQFLRLQGQPVITDAAGVRLSRDPAEVRACAEALRRRYITQALTARALKRTAVRLEGQEELRLWG